MVLAAMVLPVFGNPSTPLSGEGALEINVKAGRLSLKADQVPLERVLSAIGTRAGIKIETGNLADVLRERVTLHITDAPIEEVLKKLFAHRAFVYEFDPERNLYTLTEASVFSDGVQGADGKIILQGSETGDPEKNENPVLPLKNRLAVKTKSQLGEPKRPPRPAYVAGEIIVRLKENVDKEKVAELHAALSSKVLGRKPALRLERIQLRDGLDEDKALEHYRASNMVEMAGRNALRYFNVTPNDPQFASQWGHGASGAPESWEFTTGSTDVVVAVIDTGIRFLHPDLAGNIWVNPNEIPGNNIDDDNNGYVDDVRGWNFANNNANPTDGDAGSHGTRVSGIIGAGGNNAIGITGVAWNIRIMPLKVFPDGVDSAMSWDVIDALDYARDNGARVVNCSFGGSAYDSDEYLAFAELRNAGILAVCAAGNGAEDNGTPVNTDVTPYYPSSYNLDNIVSVAAGNQTDGLAYFSNYGAASVDLTAPGVNILSTVNNTGYDYENGTSMAAPFVSGVAGLILSRKPGWYYPELKAAILNTVTKIPLLSGKVLSGGKLNAHYALCSSGTATGDVTCDNSVGADDSVAAMQIVTGRGPEVCTACISAGIDINGDQKIGLEEAAYAMRKNAGL
jgi:subtilisin family serine protease